MQRLRNLLRRGPADWWLLLWVGLLLAGIRTGLALLSFQRMRRLLARGAQPPPTAVVPPAELERLVWAVNRMGRLIVADRPCLTQALAVQLLFARRGYATELRIGVAKERPDQLLAHAWVERNGKVVIGGDQSPARFTPLPSIEDVGL